MALSELQGGSPSEQEENGLGGRNDPGDLLLLLVPFPFLFQVFLTLLGAQLSWVLPVWDPAGPGPLSHMGFVPQAPLRWLPQLPNSETGAGVWFSGTNQGCSCIKKV